MNRILNSRFKPIVVNNMNKDIRKRINELKRKEEAPSGEVYQGLSLQVIETIAREFQISKREVEIAALENEVIPIKYHRNIGTIGIPGQRKLLKAKVAVIGAGGLGGSVIELLARMGVGRMVVVDGDTFAEDNLNRQLLCTEKNIRKSKVTAAVGRVGEINSAVEVTSHQAFLGAENVDSFITGCDVVIDALDNIPVRLILQEAARRLNLPLVHGAVAGFIGELMTIFPGDRGLGALFKPDQDIPPTGIETEIGTPTITPTFIAAGQVMEAVKIILRRGKPIRNRLRYFEVEEGKISEISLSTQP